MKKRILRISKVQIVEMMHFRMLALFRTHQGWGSACKIASRLFLNLFFHFWSSVEVSADLLHEISFITYCCRFSKLEQMVERFSRFSIIQY